jgi:hypothetical protein
MPNQIADTHLLFGIIALQMDFVTRDQLLDATQVWTLEKTKSLGDILVDNESLKGERRVLLDALVNEHLKENEFDPEKSLHSFSTGSSVAGLLSELNDTDVQDSLRHISTDEASFFLRNQNHSVCASQRRKNLAQRVGDIRQHWQNGSRQVALTLLHDMSTLTHEDTRDFSDWAKKELEMIEQRMESNRARQADSLLSDELPSATCQLRSSVPSQSSEIEELSRSWLQWSVGCAAITLLLVLSLSFADSERDRLQPVFSPRAVSHQVEEAAEIVPDSLGELNDDGVINRVISKPGAKELHNSSVTVNLDGWETSVEDELAPGDSSLVESSNEVMEIEQQLTQLANLVSQ